jgi:dipeptidyl aminopeptidase/acylaminoacyl peptidase
VSGVADVRKMLQQEKRDHGRAHWALAYWNEVIARGDTSKETLETISPANFSGDFTAPVLLVHGDKDNVVDYEQSRHMQRQLKRADKPVRLIKLKGEAPAPPRYSRHPRFSLQGLPIMIQRRQQGRQSHGRA